MHSHVVIRMMLLTSLPHFILVVSNCRNPSLGLATKVRAYEGASKEGSLGVTFHGLGNARESEGMNPHTPK
jgi:hypothetical protein